MKYKITILTLFIIIFYILSFSKTSFGINSRENLFSSAVVPHDNLVKTKRQEMLKLLSQKDKNIGTIILISPDHFSLDQKSVYFTDKNWNLSTGILSFDTNIGKIITKGAIKNDQLLSSDHGIYNVLTDIKTYFPKVKIVPLLLGQKLNEEKLQHISNLINSSCQSSCFLLASVDFSHYLPYVISDIHDQKSLEALKNLDSFLIRKIEVDSPQSLEILSNFAHYQKTLVFKLFASTNSGKILKNRDSESTSHILGWYEAGINQKVNKTFSFTVANNPELKTNIKKGVSERFLFGTDYTETNLKSQYNLGKMLIIPSAISKISYEKNKLIIYLAPDLTVSGILSNNKLKIVISPLNLIDKPVTFLKGVDKTIYFDNLFKNLPENLQKNKYEGTLFL